MFDTSLPGVARRAVPGMARLSAMARGRHRRTTERSGSRRVALAVGIGAPVLVVVLLVAAWAIDSSGADVGRNVSVGGHDVGNRNRAQLDEALDELGLDYEDAPVRIVTPETTYETTAGALGLSLDTEATAQAALAADDDALPLRPLAWAVSLVREREVALRFDVDGALVAATLTELQGEARTAPVEPGIDPTPEGIMVVPGTPGTGIDAAEVAAALPEAASDGTTPIVVETEPAPLAPRFTDADAQVVADQANQLGSRQLTVTVADDAVELPADVVRSWMRATPGEAALELRFDQEAITATLSELFPDSGTEPVDASFDVVGGTPVVIPSQDGTVCCEEGAAAKVLEALQADAGGVEIALVTIPPGLSTAEANALGIVEEVGQPDEFGPTTQHACCQPRVENIHRIADIIRGQVLEPGERFSVNEFVGRRTRDRGFVDAPVIYQGEFTSDIGGGVSQFATTLFNAAFFAGLDIPTYQSHSIRIDRYPLGREATISFPAPDLVLENTTPHGVLLWPTYTDTTITVGMYSTRNVEVVAGGTSSSRQGNCTRITTPRVRTYADGRVVEDSFFGLYRPGEGVNC